MELPCKWLFCITVYKHGYALQIALSTLGLFADSRAIMTSGTRYDPSEAGTWVQLHLNCNFLPWIDGAG